MIEIAYILWCVIASYLGCRFVVWAMKRNLPVPSGAFAAIRFFVVWCLTLVVSVFLYMLVAAGPFIYLISNPDRFGGMEESVLIFGGLILQLPYWVGFFKGIDLQVTRRFST
ncbi:hypothetical protein [Aliiroseovarius sp. S253]|uniref:hypothetical protein n=1 Tax=Aliiroseovarius sp. S253 TaxID=3415133 RepID=UPI003C7E74A0